MQGLLSDDLLTYPYAGNQWLDDLVEDTFLQEVEEIIFNSLLVFYLVCELMRDVLENVELTLLIRELDVHALH